MSIFTFICIILVMIVRKYIVNSTKNYNTVIASIYCFRQLHFFLQDEQHLHISQSQYGLLHSSLHYFAEGNFSI